METSRQQTGNELTADKILRSIGNSPWPDAKLVALNVFWKNDQKGGFSLSLKVDEKNPDEFREALAKALLSYVVLWDGLSADDKLKMAADYQKDLDNSPEFIISAGASYAGTNATILACHIVILELTRALIPDEYNGTQWIWVQ